MVFTPPSTPSRGHGPQTGFEEVGRISNGKSACLPNHVRSGRMTDNPAVIGACGSACDILIQISVCNRGPEPATVRVLPTLLFRNTWTWWPHTPKPSLRQITNKNGSPSVAASHTQMGERYLYCDGNAALLFTENETNNERIFGTPNVSPYVKDGINNCVVNGKRDAANPDHTGTKAAAHYQLNVGAGETATVRPRLSDLGPAAIAIRLRALLKSCRLVSMRRTSSIEASGRSRSARMKPS